MRIHIETIPHNDQRYETVGDWWFDDETQTLNVRVSDMGDWRYEALVAVHEQLEALVAKCRDIPQEAVDAFDKSFEHRRLRSGADDTFLFRGRRYDIDAEPGDSPDAPYYKEHQFASGVERLFARELGVSWLDYETAVATMQQDKDDADAVQRLPAQEH